MPYGNMASETLFQQRWNGAEGRGARIIVTENGSQGVGGFFCLVWCALGLVGMVGQMD